MKANIYYLDLLGRMVLSIRHNSIQNNLNNTPIHYLITGKQKIFFKNVLVFCSIYFLMNKQRRIEPHNLKEYTEF